MNFERFVFLHFNANRLQALDLKDRKIIVRLQEKAFQIDEVLTAMHEKLF